MIYALGDSRPQLLGDGHFVAPNAAVFHGRQWLAPRADLDQSPAELLVVVRV